jgi:uncharacterized 2Fe-2S/4Fe-4S cluster protein (DUF4445 family)
VKSATVTIRLEPWATEFELATGSPLQPALSAQGVEFPCGGSGICGGCRIRVLAGSLPITTEDESVFSSDELVVGWRLACRARADSSLVLECGQSEMNILADSSPVHPGRRTGLGIAIDLGTTTIAAQLIHLATGEILAVRTALNQQVRFGSDIMTRIGAVISGADLTNLIREQLASLVADIGQGRLESIREVVLVGNTVMHHLFCGISIEPLSHAPFQPSTIDEQRFLPAALGWPLPANCTIRFAPCIGGFVGSDILSGIFATRVGNSDELTALIDLGTNGEIAVGNRLGIVCASTAAGPAFEAGSIRMGMRAAPGAIAHVSATPGGLQASTIGDIAPRGICGSGLVDSVAAGLGAGAVLPSGRVSTPDRTLPIAGPVVLYQSDIRELQLAKAAIASGLRLLLDHLGASADDLSCLHLAGAFGNYLHVESAIAIGLFSVSADRIHPAGNTALRGARMMLVSGDAPHLPPIRHVALASLPKFQDEFERSITFPSLTCSSSVVV